MLKTLLLFECEKHPRESEWSDQELGDRVIGKQRLLFVCVIPMCVPGILLQLVSCLQCRRCPHYFIQALDLLRNKPGGVLEQAAKAAWDLVRELILNPNALQKL